MKTTQEMYWRGMEYYLKSYDIQPKTRKRPKYKYKEPRPLDFERDKKEDRWTHTSI